MWIFSSFINVIKLKPQICDASYSGNNPVDFDKALIFISINIFELFAQYRHLFCGAVEIQLVRDAEDQEVTC